MRTAIALVLLAFALSSCSLLGSDSEEGPSIDWTPIDFSRFAQDPSLLGGQWEWTRSNIYGPNDPAVVTPERTDRTETLVFPSLDTVRVYRNDTLIQQTSRESFFERTKWGVRNDTLATSTVYRDGPEKIYERVE